MIASTTNGLNLIIPSTSTNNVFSDSSSKFALCIFMRGESMFLADQTCLPTHHLCGLLTGNFFLAESATWIHHFPYEWPLSNIYLALSLCSHDIASLSYWIVLTLAMSSNKCSKWQYEGVCVYTFDHFNTDGMPCKTCRAPWCFNVSFFFDGKWTKYVHTKMSKLGSFFNLSCGKSTIICSTTFLLSLLQVTHLEILLCSLLSFLWSPNIQRI